MDTVQSLRIEPLTESRMEDFAAVVNPNHRQKHCWCLSHRLSAREIRERGGEDRYEAMCSLAREEIAPGVIAYLEDQPVGWCSISPRAQIPRLENSKLIRPVDELKVWSIICMVVRAGYRRRGVNRQMVLGALGYAKSLGAPAVEAYPVDPEGRMDLTMAFVGTRTMFEEAGFEVVGISDAVASRMPRLIMRKML
ncbi:GNAT family N-acetyltransferase [Glutamicibacter sp. JL.03c]|uniref:GNAT family N-acetyltransferase n=1 Tax=Glutamicibacter sp. JL.03c TaxID=2984842 RepID=UPI0021F6ED0F|nr:GNAT family N-acetyltransferase [Glutamicibacter sp. JL.03c]UYQ77177.1 GNAT family N-acetyltransferase [Glutamicibacter sp. JL.03c]